MKAPLKDRDRRRDIKGKLKQALDLMVFGREDRVALPWNEAAQAAGFRVDAMRKALDRPHVRRYLMASREVLRVAVSGQTISRLAVLRDQDSNMNAAVRAAMALEQIGTAEQSRPSIMSMPGFIVQIVNVPQPGISQAHTIEHVPTTIPRLTP
jgi:hypothetical protein